MDTNQLILNLFTSFVQIGGFGLIVTAAYTLIQYLTANLPQAKKDQLHKDYQVASDIISRYVFAVEQKYSNLSGPQKMDMFLSLVNPELKRLHLDHLSPTLVQGIAEQTVYGINTLNLTGVTQQLPKINK